MTLDKSFTARQRIEQLEDAYNDLVPMVERALKIAKDSQEAQATAEADMKEEIGKIEMNFDGTLEEIREQIISKWWWQFWK